MGGIARLTGIIVLNHKDDFLDPMNVQKAVKNEIITDNLCQSIHSKEMEYLIFPSYEPTGLDTYGNKLVDIYSKCFLNIYGWLTQVTFEEVQQKVKQMLQSIDHHHMLLIENIVIEISWEAEDYAYQHMYIKQVDFEIQ